MRPCDRCDYCCINFDEKNKKYFLTCLNKENIKNENQQCEKFTECEKDNIDINVSNKDWSYVIKSASKLNMDPIDFASKIVEQKLRKIIEKEGKANGEE